MMPDGWHYVPHGSPEPVQTVAPMLGGGPADGGYTDIGSVDELADHIPVHGEQHVHYYALERRARLGTDGFSFLWVYVFVKSEKRAAA